MYAIYEVKEGDTLASIASKIGVPIDELSNINGIMVSKILSPGEYIVVPNKTNENLYFKRYNIQKGDTIYDIARRYGINPNDLLRLNGLNNADTIYPDDIIFVPRENVSFYITGMDDTLNGVLKKMNISADELASQNSTIYLTNDQLIIYRK